MKLIGVILGQNCEKTIGLAIESLIECDKIIYCDGGSTDKTLKIAKNKLHWEKPVEDKIISNEWDSTKVNMASIQKNFVLDYLKQNHMGDYVIYLDADEMLDDDGVRKIKEFIKKFSKDTFVFDVRMRHLIYNLRFEDAINVIHRTPTRLFKVSKELYYPKMEHCIIEGQVNTGFMIDTTIWHLAYCGGVWDIEKRYNGQTQKRGIGSHDINFLNQWKNAHIFGNYPVKNVNSIELPKLLLEKFDIDKDMLYFQNRQLEVKHSVMVKQWNDYFKPKSVLDLGCGRGPYLYFWKWYVKGICTGIELSQWAVDNAFYDNIYQGNICEPFLYTDTPDIFRYDLITALDVLEHINNEDLDKTLQNMSKYGKQFIFSLPFIGDPNLEADSTHIQKKTREDWIKLINSYGIELEPTPLEWSFHEQILIGRKKD